MKKSEAKVGVRVRVVEDRIGDLSDKSFKERKGNNKRCNEFNIRYRSRV